MELLVVGVIIACFALIIVLLSSNHELTDSSKRTMAQRNWHDHRVSLHDANDDFDPETEEWVDRDGTPCGAIEDMLMDTDGDGDWDDSDGDGMPDDWD